MNEEFHSYLKIYEPIIKAIVNLFHPFVEAAVHDLNKGRIAAIYHNISQRNVGDVSPLHELKINTTDFPDYFPCYYKRNWDGRPLKCTSITIRDKNDLAIGLICFNVDASFAQDIHQRLGTFLKTQDKAENPVEIFGGQCEERATALIQQYLYEKSLSLDHITRKQKQEIVQFLYHKGLFNYKNATPFVAQYLDISRATVYNYINLLGEQ